MASPSEAVVLLAYTFFSFEFITNIFVLTIACLNLAVIGPTKLLHPNLKFILITQSVTVMLCVLNRSAMLVPKFFSTDDLFTPANLILQIVIVFEAIFRRILGHALIIERVVATLFTNSYENYRKFYFSMAWFSITFIIAFINTITNGQSWTVTAFNLITVIFSTVSSFVEFLIIIIIGRYNQRKYDSQIEEASPNNYHIGQRYQVSENVKTAKQLLPAFFCIFLSNLVTALLYSIIAFNLVNESYQISLAYAFFTWTDTMLGAAIELTVITHHPLLKKRFVRILKNIFCFKRNQVGVEPNCTETAIGRNDNNEGTEHFKMLQQLWNK
uniref:Gustatory receptor n=1 Tax=Globodera rostochiensis TaxID=31243 RepID=A0A914HC89_GLORO